ncbi:AfsR/SARP family transcriptional regulator [Kribbella deserti]|uniref:BTAD domain-containing putative transcriptional regulator n=1 Tax=Kribbella deserti TaxID=1926257 RepID=A0ABV6QT37_9ACTN
MTEALRIDLLGPLTVRFGGRALDMGPVRQQVMLAVLALRANQISTAEELLDAVWGEKPPPTGLKVIPPYIYRIRKLLPSEGLLDRTRDGYVLRVPEDCVDVQRFESAVKTAGQQSDPVRAAELYAEALALFRGEPLSGLPGSYLSVQRHRLVERRDKVLSDRIELDLANGRHAELVPELVGLVADRPLDERFASQLMLALYRSGRQAEALANYSKTRAVLVDQLGVEPGPELRAAHQTILRNEPSTPRSRDELPYSGAAFIGRTTELAEVIAALRPGSGVAPPVVTIDGMAGVGKTALAVRAGRDLARVYPDGQLFVDLHGHTPGRTPLAPERAVDHLLRSIDVPANQIPQEPEERLAFWRSQVAGKRLLIILDNAFDSASVEPLLPGAPTCGVLVTSRRQLTSLDARARMALDVLARSDASALLSQIIGAARSGQETSAALELVERCGHLPLAIRIAGSRLRHRPAWTVAHLNQRLDAQDRRLTELSADGSGVASAFAVSYEQLTADQQRMFRRLSLMPGKDTDAYGAGALTDTPAADAEEVLEALVDANLLLQPEPGRFQFHDLLRQYAAQVARAEESDQERTDAICRLLEYYLQTTQRSLQQVTQVLYADLSGRPVVPGPSVGADLAWCDAEWPNLVAAVAQAESIGRDDLAWLLANVVAPYLHRRTRLDEIDAVLTIGLAAAERLGDSEGRARLLHLRGHYGRIRCGARKGIADLRQAADLSKGASPALRAHILSSLGYATGWIDSRSEWPELLKESVRLARKVGHEPLAALTLGYLGSLYGDQWDFTNALVYYQEALATAERIGDERLQPDLLNGIAECHLKFGESTEALQAAMAAKTLAQEHRLEFSLQYTMNNLGDAYRLLGEHDLAVETHQQGLVLAVKNCTHLGENGARLHLGHSLLAAGRVDDSQEQFEIVLRRTANQQPRVAAQALEGLADCAEHNDDPGEARALLRQALVQLGQDLPVYAERLQVRLDRLTGHRGTSVGTSPRTAS